MKTVDLIVRKFNIRTKYCPPSYNIIPFRGLLSPNHGLKFQKVPKESIGGMQIQEGLKIFEQGNYLNGSLDIPVRLDG